MMVPTWVRRHPKRPENRVAAELARISHQDEAFSGSGGEKGWPKAVHFRHNYVDETK
jgi:hypothetical protein